MIISIFALLLPSILALLAAGQKFGQNANWYYAFNDEDVNTFQLGSVTADSANGGIFITGTANSGMNAKRIAVGYVMTCDGERMANFREETFTDFTVEQITIEPSLANLYYVFQAKPRVGVTIADKFGIRVCDLQFPEENECFISDNSDTLEMIDTFISNTFRVHESGEMVMASITSSINGQVCADSQGYLRRYDKNGYLEWVHNRAGSAGSAFEFLTQDSGFIGFSNATNAFMIKFGNSTELLIGDVGDVTFNCVAQNPIVGVLIDQDRDAVYAFGTSLADTFRNYNTSALFGSNKRNNYFISKFDLNGNHVKTEVFDSLRNITLSNDEDALVTGVLDPVTGDIILAGNTRGSFTGSYRNTVDKDIFLMRLNSNLLRIGVNQYGDSHDDTVSSIAIDRVKNVLYVVGKSSAAFGMNFTSTKIFVAELPLYENQIMTTLVSSSSSMAPMTTLAPSNATIRPSSLYLAQPLVEDLGSLVRFIKKYSPPASSSTSAKATSTRTKAVTTTNRPNDDLSKFIYSIMDTQTADAVLQYITYILIGVGLIFVLIVSCCSKFIYSRFFKREKVANETMNAFEIYQRQNNIQVKDLNPTSRLRREDTKSMNRFSTQSRNSSNVLASSPSPDKYRLSAMPTGSATSTGSMTRSPSKTMVASDTALTRSEASLGVVSSSNSNLMAANNSYQSNSRLNGVQIGSSSSRNSLAKSVVGNQTGTTLSRSPTSSAGYNQQTIGRAFSPDQTISRPNGQTISRQSTTGTSPSRGSPLQKSTSKSKLSDLDDLTNSLSSFK